MEWSVRSFVHSLALISILREFKRMGISIVEGGGFPRDFQLNQNTSNLSIRQFNSPKKKRTSLLINRLLVHSEFEIKLINFFFLPPVELYSSILSMNGRKKKLKEEKRFLRKKTLDNPLRC